MRVLHILDHSLPYFSGYAFRSSYLLRAQKRLGLDPVVVTSPGHEQFQNSRELVEGIEHYRCYWPEQASPTRYQTAPMIKQMTSLNVLTKEVTRLAAELGVDLIHAHSPSVNGMAAARAAAQLGLPWIYELRYYDEDAAVDRGKIRHNSIRYRVSQRVEQSVLAEAPRIAVISAGLREDLMRRGIDEQRIIEIPNGVDPELFRPLLPDTELVRRYGLSGRIVIGFIGSIYPYEGLDQLVRAGIELLGERRDIKLLIAGEGESLDELRALVPESLRDEIIFTGKVLHHQVQRYYSVMDIMVYPRIRSRLTDLTTPLKPLEAMSMSKPVIVSDAGGMLELVINGENGLIYPAGRVDLLRILIGKVADDAAGGLKLGRRARSFVIENRDWRRIVTKYLDLYGELTGRMREARN
ncbi:MAG: glycosyltransferase [Acidobacteriota bacterium]|nr:MAG: glycosyltransferase [Acidobacteriota bacterium]